VSDRLSASVARQFLLGLVLAGVAGFLSYHLKFLTLSGAIAAVIIGTLVFGGGGLPWAIPLLVFFFSSSILSGLRSPADTFNVFEKSSRRDAWQVVANGGAGAMLVVASFLHNVEGLYVAYLGSLAAVTADTWATEIGMRTEGKTVSLISFRPVPPGTSGGVSLVGTLSGIFGALVLSLSVLWYMQRPAQFLVIFVVSGFVGSMIDSILGATIQAQRRCTVCGKIVEGRLHCSVATSFHRGIRWLTNDWVNVACSFSGALAAWILANVI